MKLRLTGALLLMALAGGCGTPSLADRDEQIVLVPGAQGGSGYGGLRKGLRDAGIDTRISTFRWGAPALLFVLNFQNRAIHNAAESGLAERVAAWHEHHPSGRLVVIAHSAGCGVALGALGRLSDETKVDQVILLAPSVSPGYDLTPALAHIRNRLDVFYSDRDTLFLHWRTSTFGTYDNVRTPAAGHLGFSSVSKLASDLRCRVVQHAYDTAWRELGNDGGHWGTLSRRFVGRVLAPDCDLGSPPAPVQ